MTDAAHNQHSETRHPSDRDRIVTTGPSRFQPGLASYGTSLRELYGNLADLTDKMLKGAWSR